MGQSEYGLYALVASVITYLTILDLGFGNAIIRYTAQFRAEKKLGSNILCLGCSSSYIQLLDLLH